jgi:hypothetical protein
MRSPSAETVSSPKMTGPWKEESALWRPSERYPDPIEILDPPFLRYRIFNAAVERLFTGARSREE